MTTKTAVNNVGKGTATAETPKKDAKKEASKPQVNKAQTPPQTTPQASRIPLIEWAKHAKKAGVSAAGIALIKLNSKPADRLTAEGWFARYNDLLAKPVEG